MASHHTPNRIQSPSLAARHCVVSTLPTYSVSSLNTLTVTHSVPSTLALRIYTAFPIRGKLCGCSQERQSSLMTSSLTAILLTDCFLSFRAQLICVFCYVLFSQTCQSGWHIIEDQKRWRKERKEKKKEKGREIILHCFLHTVWSYKYINPDNSILKLTHYAYYYKF